MIMKERLKNINIGILIKKKPNQTNKKEENHHHNQVNPSNISYFPIKSHLFQIAHRKY